MSNNRKRIKTFTKQLVIVLTAFAILWISISYIYAGIALIKYGVTDALSELSQQVCVVIVGTVISYCAKSFWENKAQANTALEYHKFDTTHTDDLSFEDDSSNAVG